MPDKTYNCFNCGHKVIIPASVLVLDEEGTYNPEVHILCKNCAHTARVAIREALPGLEME